MCADIDPPPFPLDEAIREALLARSPARFRASAFFLRHGELLDRWLTTPRVEEPMRTPSPGGEDRIRIVHWNIQQGKHWERLLAAIETQPRLGEADIWSLNEVDIGMARSGNRDGVRELARHLGLHAAFVANYLELTKGPGADRDAEGENRLGMHGLALLSRWPFLETRSAPLPECWDYFRFAAEKRYGCRRVLWAEVAHPRGPLLVATVHTEVRNAPACRDRQIAAALAAIPDRPGILAGDWNTHTFHRGGLVAQAREFLRIVRTPDAILDASLLDPRAREPLMGRIEQAGFDLADWNGRAPTARQVLAGVEELGRIPTPLARALSGRFGLDRRVLRMRLDWIGARGPWNPGNVWTLTEVGPEGTGASDHAPIGAEAVWAGR
jgi:endonuclease/exonuclease/phosphatase family metal-dependent hydrolase